MGKKLSIIVLLAVILSVTSGCGPQGAEPSGQESVGIESGIAAINRGAERFSELKNGTLEATAAISSENNALEAMNTGESGSLTTFISRSKGYDFIQETNAKNEGTREISYSAVKQVSGDLFYSFVVEPTQAEREQPYEWNNPDGEGGEPSYGPNGTLKMMTGPFKLLSDVRYIKSITREETDSFEKYTVTASDAYAEYMKVTAHSQKENYIVHEHREVYWIDQSGLLTKSQIREEFEWTIDGITDTYVSDITVELTGYNYKKLKKIGDELPSMIFFDGSLYTESSAVLDINSSALTRIGSVKSTVSSVQEPEGENEANRPIKNAEIYKSGENSIIVKYIDYKLYEKND